MNRELDDVRDVVLNWSGSDVHLALVGDHFIQCTVTRLVKTESRDRKELVEQCWEVPFTIVDTDECTLPPGHAMAHKCQWPSKCVNTVGSYECECEAIDTSISSPWNVALPSSSCSGRKTTEGCCSFDAQSDEGCRTEFSCPVDPCDNPRQKHDCDKMAVCQRTSLPGSKPNYVCKCPHGTLGNGRKCISSDAKQVPKVQADGITPTAQTLSRTYCSCTKPVIDPCDGFYECSKNKHQICVADKNNTPKCVCKEGFKDKGDEYGCVDMNPPLLKLRCDHDGDGITKLKQGDTYVECAIDVVDENAEDLMRSLKITYSEPLLHGCLTKTGDFEVKYSVATPWTNPPLVSIVRTVRVEDLDVCSLTTSQTKSICPELLPKCDEKAGALCVNTFGSYYCQCPLYTSGDGFLPIPNIEQDVNGNYIDAPDKYDGGTSCVDTSKPIIQLSGPNPKKLRKCRCERLGGILAETNNKLEEESSGKDVEESQENDFEGELKSLIQASDGVELCISSETYRSGEKIECFHAFDKTYKGDVNLSDRVVVGNPIPVPGQMKMWRVPYDVIDHAGNRADTVYRVVEIEELSFQEYERQLLEEQESVIQKRVAALETELEQYKQNNNISSRGRNKRDNKRNCPKCPTCPECICKEADCRQFCSNASSNEKSPNECPSIPASSAPFLVYSLIEFVDLIPSFTLSLASLIVFTLFLLIVSRLANSLGTVNRANTIDENRERVMRDSITYFSPPPSQRSQRVHSSASPFAVDSSATFQRSPHSGRLHQNGNDDSHTDIYARTPTS